MENDCKILISIGKRGSVKEQADTGVRMSRSDDKYEALRFVVGKFVVQSSFFYTLIFAEASFFKFSIQRDLFFSNGFVP